MWLHPQLGLSPILYMAYALAFIILPSYACSRLLPQKDLGLAEGVCLGFPISQALLFLLAWGGSRLGLSWWGALGLPALGIYGLWELFKTRKNGLRSEPFFLISVTAITTISLTLCFRYFIQTKLPGEGLHYTMYGDDAMMSMWTFSAIKGLRSGLPFMEGSIGDLPFTYHIQMFANNGIANILTGIHPAFIQLYIYPVLFWYMLAGGIVASARRLAGFNRKQTILAVIFILYTSGLSFETLSTTQMYAYFHTYFFSLPPFIIMGMLLFGVFSKHMAKLPGVYFAFLFFGACSAKAVPLILIPLSLLPVFFYRLLNNEANADDFKCSAGILLSALTLRIIEYTSSGHMVFKKFNLLNSTLFLGTSILEVAPYIIIIIIITNDRLAKHKTISNNQFNIFAFSMFLLSITLTRTIEFVGGYHYFYWYSRIIFLICIAYIFSFAITKFRVALATATITLVICAMLAFIYSEYRSMRAVHAMEGMASLSPQEWDGLMWAYNTLDHNAFILSNGARGNPNGKMGSTSATSFDDLAVSGLYGYAWPSDWRPLEVRDMADKRLAVVEAFWKASSTVERQRLLANLPVDYLFVHKNNDRALDYTGLTGVRKIYCNDEFDIYALRGASPQN